MTFSYLLHIHEDTDWGARNVLVCGFVRARVLLVSEPFFYSLSTISKCAYLGRQIPHDTLRIPRSICGYLYKTNRIVKSNLLRLLCGDPEQA